MDKKNSVWLIVAGAALFLFYRFGKRAGSDGFGSGAVGCTSSMDADTLKAAALKLRSLLSEWYVDTTDEALILNVFRRFPDECAVRKLYSLFGNMDTTFYGSGDLDFWMKSRVSESTLSQCRLYGFGVTNF